MPVDRRRSDEGLTRCLRCHRHIRAAETPSQTRCPFCDTTGALRIVRSTALAGLLGLAGCGSVEPSTSQPVDTTETVDTQQADEGADQGSEQSQVTPPAPDTDVMVPAYGRVPAPPPEAPPRLDEDEETSASDQVDETERAEDTFEQQRPQKMRQPRYGRIPIRRPRSDG